MLYSDWLFGWVSEEMTLQHKTIIYRANYSTVNLQIHVQYSYTLLTVQNQMVMLKLHLQNFFK